MLSAGQSRRPSAASNPYSGSTPPEAYSRPDRRTAKPSRAAAVQGWRAAPPEGLVLDCREHDGSIARLGASRRPPAARVPHGRGGVEVAGVSSEVRRVIAAVLRRRGGRALVAQHVSDLLLIAEE